MDILRLRTFFADLNEKERAVDIGNRIRNSGSEEVTIRVKE